MNLKKVLKISQIISPKLTAQLVFNYISKPKNKKIRPFEKSIIEKAEKKTIKFKEFKIKTYKWGNGNKTALVVHGWGGRASNFGAIIPELTKKGYSVISFDGPCHGASTKKKTSFFEMADLVKLFLSKDKFDLIITHSMGSVLTFSAMASLRYNANQMIVLTTPFKFIQFIELAVTQFGLTGVTTDLLINKIRKTTKQFDPLSYGVSTVIEDISVNDITFIHDKDDKTLPIEDTKSVSLLFKNSKFVEIEATGHFRMLWSKKVIEIIKHQISH